MKFNGKRVRIYKDKLGPYDGYFKRGNIYSYLGKHQTVTRAFDCNGEHYGIIRRKWYVKEILLIVLILLALAAGVFFLVRYEKQDNKLVLFMPHAPTYENGELILEIVNLSNFTTYINIERLVYELPSGDYLYSLPCQDTATYITITYNGYTHREEIVHV